MAIGVSINGVSGLSADGSNWLDIVVINSWGMYINGRQLLL